MVTYDHSTLSILEVPIEKLKLNHTGHLQIKVGVLHSIRGSVEHDDYLETLEDNWISLSIHESEQGYLGLTEKLEIAAGQSKEISLEKGAGNHGLMVVAPMNLSKSDRSVLSDRQSLTATPNYKP